MTPTDPIVSSPIVTGHVARDDVPQRLRDNLSTEAAANDGLTYLFVLLPMLALLHDDGVALADWSRRERHEAMETPGFLGFTIARSLLTLAAAGAAKMNGVLAVYVAAYVFSRTIGEREKEQEEHVQEAINQFFLIPIFVLLGVHLPIDAWWSQGWTWLAGAIAIVLGRRAVAALFYVALVAREAGRDDLWPIVALVITVSVVVHGVTATPLSRWLGRAGRG